MANLFHDLVGGEVNLGLTLAVLVAMPAFHAKFVVSPSTIALPLTLGRWELDVVSHIGDTDRKSVPLDRLSSAAGRGLERQAPG